MFLTLSANPVYAILAIEGITRIVATELVQTADGKWKRRVYDMKGQIVQEVDLSEHKESLGDWQEGQGEV